MCAITVLDGLLRSCTWKRSLKMGLPPELVRFAWSGQRSGGKSRIVGDLRHTLAKVDAYRYLQRAVRICPVLSWLGGTGTRLSLSSSRSWLGEQRPIVQGHPPLLKAYFSASEGLR